MQARIALAALAVVALPAASPAQDGAGGPLGRLAWLAGCWERRAGATVSREIWSPPLGDLMVGASVSARDGRARAWEHLRIQSRDGNPVYIALPSGQRQAEFPATAVSDSAVAFENPEHDFPRKITYRRRGSDSLVARVEGPGPNGPRGFDLAMARVACEQRAP